LAREIFHLVGMATNSYAVLPKAPLPMRIKNSGLVCRKPDHIADRPAILGPSIRNYLRRLLYQPSKRFSAWEWRVRPKERNEWRGVTAGMLDQRSLKGKEVPERFIFPTPPHKLLSDTQIAFPLRQLLVTQPDAYFHPGLYHCLPRIGRTLPDLRPSTSAMT
jgi:hypothetical protein